jgi:ketosteroid isomerase-like protein
MGAALDSVTAAFAAVSERRFDELESLLSPDIDWQGLAGDDGSVPRCHGRETAVEIMRRGAAAAGEVTVGALSERGDRVVARVASPRREGEWFVVAEVRDGMIADLRAYRDEADARAALGAEG